MTSEIKSPLMPLGIREICKDYSSPAWTAINKAASGSVNYYPIDLLMEVIILKRLMSFPNSKDDKKIEELTKIEVWILSFATNWTIDASRGKQYDHKEIAKR